MALRPRVLDTPLAIEQEQFERLRRLQPEERLRLAGRLSASLERLVIAELRQRFPDASEEELRRRAGVRRLGRELALRMYGEQPWIE